MTAVFAPTLEQLFLEARTHGHWLDKPVPAELLQKIYDTARWAPTAMNSQPARFVFVVSKEAKDRLEPTLSEGNREKTRLAPVTVIVATDTRFYENLPTQFPAYDAKPIFEANADMARDTAARNSTLQGAYLLLAARALGLDAGPMSGFDPAAVNAEFFPDGRFQANFLINLGYADHSKVYPRGPRLGFEEVATVL